MAPLANPLKAPTAPPTSSSSSGSGAKRLTARQKARARLADPTLPRKLHREDNVVTDRFIDSKRDKQLIKRSVFVSRVQKSSDKQRSSSKLARRRRPSKKLLTTLDALGDALDDIRHDMDESGAMDAAQAAQGKIRHKSLRSRPGALKRKERVVKGEMERFGRSLAQLATVTTAAAAPQGQAAAAAAVPQAQQQMVDERMDTATTEQAASQQQQAPSATSGRWAALRGFISATMEQNPVFLGKE